MSRTTFLHVAGPERQVISEELHDQGRILVALLRECVEFGNRIIKCLLGEVARTVGRVEDLVVEYREVEGKTEADWVGRREFSDRNVRRGLVGFERLVGAVLALVASGKLRKVTVIVTHPIGTGQNSISQRQRMWCQGTPEHYAQSGGGFRQVGSKEKETVANEIGKQKREK